MTYRPCLFKWDAGERVMRLNPRFENVAIAQYEDGSDYPLWVREGRSSVSHAHLFACINEAWKNLDDETLEILRTPNLLRGWCLIQGGYFNQSVQHAGDKDFSFRMAMAMRSAHDAANEDGYAEFVPRKIDGDWYVISRTPKSMRHGAMDKDEFNRCKQDLLVLLSGAIHVSRRTLEREGKLRGEDQ